MTTPTEQDVLEWLVFDGDAGPVDPFDPITDARVAEFVAAYPQHGDAIQSFASIWNEKPIFGPETLEDHLKQEQIDSDLHAKLMKMIAEKFGRGEP